MTGIEALTNAVRESAEAEREAALKAVGPIMPKVEILRPHPLIDLRIKGE